MMSGASGALVGGVQVTSDWYGGTVGSNAGHFIYWNFKSSYCSSIYGRSSTVTPLSRKCRYLIRY